MKLYCTIGNKNPPELSQNFGGIYVGGHQKEQIKHIYHTHKGRYGYRRICAELNQTLAGQ
ncbi:IS3 family transposase, partial [Moraxella caprae]|uniref:IS3 family transposase n=1 Tax=Moraxella caprae TaxID=90240 RepID=UPI0012EB1F24